MLRAAEGGKHQLGCLRPLHSHNLTFRYRQIGNTPSQVTGVKSKPPEAKLRHLLFTIRPHQL